VLDTKSPKHLEMAQGHISLSEVPGERQQSFTAKSPRTLMSLKLAIEFQSVSFETTSSIIYMSSPIFRLYFISYTSMLLKMHKWLTHILLPMHKGS
jgi:hypothetical protein